MREGRRSLPSLSLVVVRAHLVVVQRLDIRVGMAYRIGISIRNRELEIVSKMLKT